MANPTNQAGRADAYAPMVAKASFVDTICKWILRLMLPMLLSLGGLLFYWVWLDGEHTMVLWRIVGMIPLAVSFTAIAIWAFQAWLPPAGSDHREPQTTISGRRKQRRIFHRN
jgi:hypothetical protein